MDACTYFFVEHVITDKQGWDGWMSSWRDIYGADDMTVDKALAYPEWEGNECVLSIPTADGKMTMCLWKMPYGTTKDEFQEFIDRFCCGYAINNVFQVDRALGIKKLDVRGFFSDFINAAQGRQSPGYLDSPMLWMTHHHILDRQGFTDFDNSVGDKIYKTCNTASDCQSIFPAGHSCCLTLWFTSNDMVCFDATSEDFTQEVVQKAEDEFTKGLSKNYVYKLNTENGLNAFHLSKDNWSQDALAWANSSAKTIPASSSSDTANPVGIEAGQ